MIMMTMMMTVVVMVVMDSAEAGHSRYRPWRLPVGKHARRVVLVRRRCVRHHQVPTTRCRCRCVGVVDSATGLPPHQWRHHPASALLYATHGPLLAHKARIRNLSKDKCVAGGKGGDFCPHNRQNLDYIILQIWNAWRLPTTVFEVWTLTCLAW